MHQHPSLWLWPRLHEGVWQQQIEASMHEHPSLWLWPRGVAELHHVWQHQEHLDITILAHGVF